MSITNFQLSTRALDWSTNWGPSIYSHFPLVTTFLSGYCCDRGVRLSNMMCLS